MRNVLIVAVAALCGCATMTLQSYVGKPVREVVLDYGPYADYRQMTEEKREYIWSFTKTTVRGTTAFSPGAATNTSCYYVLYAEYSAKHGEYVVTDYRTPRVNCM